MAGAIAISAVRRCCLSSRDSAAQLPGAHAGPIDYAHFDLPRVVRRITVAGELPEGPDGFRSRPLEGELFGVIG